MNEKEIIVRELDRVPNYLLPKALEFVKSVRDTSQVEQLESLRIALEQKRRNSGDRQTGFNNCWHNTLTRHFPTTNISGNRTNL